VLDQLRPLTPGDMNFMNPASTYTVIYQQSRFHVHGDFFIHPPFTDTVISPTMPLPMVWRCLLGLASVYLRQLCCPPLSYYELAITPKTPTTFSSCPFSRIPNVSRSAFSLWWPPFLIEPFNLRFFSYLKTALFSRSVVWSASE